jgi:hypothetical protein
MAPGGPASSPAALAFTSAAGAATLVRAANGYALYISVKTTGAVHLAFGDATVGAPTNTDPLFEAADGWQDMVLRPEQTHVRAKGDTGAGSLYIWFSGR